MAGTPKDGMDPQFAAARGNTGNSLIRSVKSRFHVGKRSPNPFDTPPSTGRTNPASPNPFLDPQPSTIDKGKGKATSQGVDGETQIRQDPTAQPSLGSDGDTVEFSQSKAVFALDVSGSTAGKVLRVEKSAIVALSDGLSSARKRDAQILPWDSHARQSLRLDELDNADSSGATNPTVLLSNANYRNSLMGSDLWFLLTDGEIDEDLVRNFALEIGAARLHGTACVIVVFASSLERPILCNISVGKAVVAVTPDCLFLFHNFETGEIFVLQSKGCFRTLLPEGKQRLNIDYSTTWEDLHKISYDQLHAMQIPLPRKPDQDSVVLSSGRFLDLNDIYNDNLDETRIQELLSSYEDLDTLILTAHTRGRADDMRLWISKRRIQSRDPTWIERPDEQELATSLTRDLVEKLRTSSAVTSQEAGHTDIGDTSGIESLRESLRACHERNWQLFASVLGIETKRQNQRNMVISACARGLDLCHSEAASPTSCTPFNSSRSPGLEDATRSASNTTTLGTRPEVRRSTSVSGSLLFLKGFQAMRKWERSRRHHVSEECYGTCGFCRETDVILCLLLKQPPEMTPTKGFPPVGSKSKHKFPLVLGNYPETDVVASLVCCDACSHFLVKYGQTPNGESLTGAFPLVSFQSEINKKSWVTILSETFQGRFHNEVLLLVLLSSVCNTIADLSLTDSMRTQAAVSALKRASHHLASIPTILTTESSVGTPIVGIDPSKPLILTLSRTLMDLQIEPCPLLFYPLDGFVVLVQVGSMMEEGLLVMFSFVWLRTLFSFTEKHYALRSTSGESASTQSLIGILTGNSDPGNVSDIQETGGHRKECSISIAELNGTYLLPKELGELATFQQLGDPFLKVQSSCATAIGLFLHALLENAPKYSSPEICFSQMKREEGLQKVFWDPEGVSEGLARDMVTNQEEKYLPMSID